MFNLLTCLMGRITGLLAAIVQATAVTLYWSTSRYVQYITFRADRTDPFQFHDHVPL